EQRRFHRSDTSFPIFQILFADYSGLKRELWAGQSAKALAALRLDRSKFVKIFREAFATSDRLMDITSEADRVLAKLKAHPSQSRTSLAFADFVFGIKEMAKLQIKSKKPMDDDDDMKSWLNDQARCIQQMARRQQYQQRGYILMDLKRKEWQIHPIQEMCFQCDEKYCLACFTLLHAKGKTATHQHISIPTCVAAPLMLLCVDCLGKRAARVHCHTCNKDVCHACAQYHPPEYCHTEPRPFESAPVENERKRLDMIKTNDLFAEEKRIQDAKAFEALQIKCAMRIQRGWRRKAEVLEMDSPTQAILRRLNVYLRHKIEARARALHVALDEYVHLGVPLPGVASIAESIGETFIRLSAPYGHMSVDKSVLYSVEFSHDHPTKLKHAASSHAVKVRDLKESKAVTASLRKIGNATQSMALRFDEDSFLGRALNRTAQHIQRSLQRQKFNQSKREREISLLSVQRSFRDRQMYSLRREQSQRWDESSTQRPASIRHVGSIHNYSVPADYYPQQSYTSAAEGTQLPDNVSYSYDQPTYDAQAYADQPTHDPQGSSQDWQQHVVPPQQPTQDDYQLGYDDYYYDQQNYDQQGYYYQPEIDHSYYTQDSTAYVEGAYIAPTYPSYSPTASVHTSYTEPVAATETEWQEAYDPSSGQVYYYNPRTGESVWHQ
ncbi:hypothetical protein B5M09_009722, partial [Aphanomyces astaci]